MYIKRDSYLNRLIADRDNGFPKVITGVHGCGKSFLLKELFRDYIKSGCKGSRDQQTG